MKKAIHIALLVAGCLSATAAFAQSSQGGHNTTGSQANSPPNQGPNSGGTPTPPTNVPNTGTPALSGSALEAAIVAAANAAASQDKGPNNQYRPQRLPTQDVERAVAVVIQEAAEDGDSEADIEAALETAMANATLDPETKAGIGAAAQDLQNLEKNPVTPNSVSQSNNSPSPQPPAPPPPPPAGTGYE